MAGDTCYCATQCLCLLARELKGQVGAFSKTLYVKYPGHSLGGQATHPELPGLITGLDVDSRYFDSSFFENHSNRTKRIYFSSIFTVFFAGDAQP